MAAPPTDEDMLKVPQGCSPLEAPAAEDELPLLAQVLPGVYLGRPAHASARGLLHEYEPALTAAQGLSPIRSIVNVSADLPNPFESAGEVQEADSDEEASLRFEYFRCDLDQPKAPVIDLIRAAARFIDESLARGRPVLLHGAEGRDGDAGAVLATYLVEGRRWDAVVAAEAVRTRCPSAALSSEASMLLRKLGRSEDLVPSSEAAQQLSPPAASEIITGFLWLGNAHAATVQGLQQLNIACVVNASRDLPFADAPEVMKLRVPVSSSGSGASAFDELLPYWNDTMSFVEDARQSKRRVLVHCLQGRSRAAAVVIGYLMKSENLSLVAALRQVRQHRRSAHPSGALAQALPELLQVCSAGGGSVPRAERWRKVAAGTVEEGPRSSWADLSDQLGDAKPLALEDGATAKPVDAAAFEASVAQLRELLGLPEDLCRETLQRHSGNAERAANELLAWLEGGEVGGTSASASSSAQAVSSDPMAPPPEQLAARRHAVFGGWAEQAAAAGATVAASIPAGVSGSGAASSSACAGPSGVLEGAPTGSRKRSSSEDGTAGSEPRQREESSRFQMSACFVEGEEEVFDCIICGRSSKRGGEPPTAHPDLGWVHRVCLEQAGWS